MSGCKAVNARGNRCGKPVTHIVEYQCLAHKRMEQSGLCEGHGTVAGRLSRRFAGIRVWAVSDNGKAAAAG